MKKIYTLFAIAFSSLVFAQGVETFDNAEIGTSYADGSFTGVNGITWSYTHSRDEGDFAIEGKGLMLRRAMDSSFSGTITGGVGTLSFQYRKAFTGGNERQLELYVNDVVVATSEIFGAGSGEDATVHTLTAVVNSSDPVTIRIKNVGDGDFNRQSVIDNITWTANSMSVSDVNASKVSMTSVWNNTANFNTKGNAIVEIFNLNGQLVQKANGSNNFELNVSNLAKGVYVVKVTVDGVATTQKVVKK